MPLLFNNGKLIIIVTALNLLGEQFVSIIKAAGFEALAVKRENNQKSVFEVSINNYSICFIIDSELSMVGRWDLNSMSKLL